MVKPLFLAAAAALALTGSAHAQTFREKATCKLTNTAAQVALYEGPCKVKQTVTGNKAVISVKLGQTEPFLFAGTLGNPRWMHGPEETQFTDLPGGGIFRWSNFALVVAE